MLFHPRSSVRALHHSARCRPFAQTFRGAFDRSCSQVHTRSTHMRPAGASAVARLHPVERTLVAPGRVPVRYGKRPFQAHQPTERERATTRTPGRHPNVLFTFWRRGPACAERLASLEIQRPERESSVRSSRSAGRGSTVRNAVQRR